MSADIATRCREFVGRTVRATDLTIGDGADTDVFVGPIELVVTEFDPGSDVARDAGAGLTDTYLWCEAANPSEAAKLPAGWSALWIYGPTFHDDGRIDKPRFVVIR